MFLGSVCVYLKVEPKKIARRNVPVDTFSLIARLRRSRSTQKYTTMPRKQIVCGALYGSFADTFLIVVRNLFLSCQFQIFNWQDIQCKVSNYLPHICKAHKTKPTKPTLQKSCNRQHTVNNLLIRSYKTPMPARCPTNNKEIRQRSSFQQDKLPLTDNK